MDHTNAVWKDRLHRSGVVAVVTLDDVDAAEPLAEGLLSGGVDVVELTLRTGSAMAALGRMCRAFPSMAIGAGTVLSPEQIRQVQDAGAAFAVAPGLNPRVVRAALDAGMPFAPGVFTPSEIEQAVDCGCRILKFFPAAANGDIRHFQSVITPYAHLGLDYIPLGGISSELVPMILRERAVVAVGGSWLAPRAVVAARDWKTVTTNARQVVEQVRGIRKAT